MDDTPAPAREILIVGAGMAAHRVVDRLLRDPDDDRRITVIGDEEYGPYDRSALSDLLSGGEPASIQLDRAMFRDDRVRLVRDDRVLHLDRRARTVRTRSRRTYSYDALVLATGSYAARVAVDGSRLPGCFVLRTIDDATAIRAFVDARSLALGRPLRAAVIGAGLLGIDAATALHDLGIGTTLVQYPDRVLAGLLDRSAAAVVQGALEDRGIAVRIRTRTTRLDPDESGAVTALEFQDGSFLRADLAVFTVGVRARDELARNAGLDVHASGGVIVDDRGVSSDPRVLAVGEVARVHGARTDDGSPGDALADVVAERLLGREARYHAAIPGVRRRFAGVEVASFGDAVAQGRDAVEVVIHRDPHVGTARTLVLSDDARRLHGGVLLGDTSMYAALREVVGSPSAAELASQLHTVTGVGDDDPTVCAHVGLSHRELKAAIETAGVRSIRAAGARFGRPSGCEQCTLAVARALVEIVSGRVAREDPVLRRERGSSPGRRWPDGSVGARVSISAGALTPAHLVEVGRLAEEFGLRPGISGDRIELHDVRPGQRAALRDRLAAAGLDAELGVATGGAPLIGADRANGRARRSGRDVGGPTMWAESPA